MCLGLKPVAALERDSTHADPDGLLPLLLPRLGRAVRVHRDIDWLDKELILAPPQGERRQLDLVARLRLRPGAPPPRTDLTDLVALVHVELESRASALAFRPRMFEYYIQLRRDTGLPVLPIALFLRVGLEGIGWDAHEEHGWERRIVRFDYAYVGLPALDGEPYATGENLLGVTLSA